MILFGDLILGSTPLGTFKRTFLQMEVGSNLSFKQIVIEVTSLQL